MNNTTRITMAIALSLVTLRAADVPSAPPPAGKPRVGNAAFLAEESTSLELRAARLACPYQFYLKYVDAPEQVTKVHAKLAKYTGEGKEPRLADDGPAIVSSAPESHVRVAVSVAYGPQDPPEFHPNPPNVETIVPGTGSTFLGLGILTHRPNGKSFSGNGGTGVISHKEIDMAWFEGPFDCAKLPFAIETEITLQDHAVPVFAWFPRGFDLSVKRDKLATKDLPKGTIIIYAAVN
jgi:hypothetical protein